MREDMNNLFLKACRLLESPPPLSPSLLLQLHAHIILLGSHHDNLIASRLIHHYQISLQSTHIPLRILNSLSSPSILPFNSLLSFFARRNLPSHAFSLFNSLPIPPNSLTFSLLLSFSSTQTHSLVLKSGFLSHPFVSNALLSLYAKLLRDASSARKVFDEMPHHRDDSSAHVCRWTSLIDVYARGNKPEEALRVFVTMVEAGLVPEDGTLVSVLSACSRLVNMVLVEKWVLILSQVVDGNNVVVGLDGVRVVLVYLFGKWGKVERSREMFDGVSESFKRRSVVPWNAVIGAYVQNGYPMEGLSVFRVMIGDPDRRSNHVTMVSVLAACAQVGGLELGRWIHEYLKSKGRRGMIGSNRILATALIDMYSKCGSLENAKEVFDQMESKDIVSFNAMIMSLAVNSEGEEALRLFSQVQDFGLRPNAGTFLGALCACSHSGFSEKGRQLFKDMTSVFSVSPRLEHYACYIDILARAGLVEEALELVTSMPFTPNSIVWGALLRGCLLHSRLDLAKYVSGKLVQSDSENTGGYVMLANAFASDHRWNDVSSLRWSMKEKGVSKQPGCSWISINGVVHEFVVGRPPHPHSDSMYNLLNGLVKQMKIPIDIL